MIQRVLERAGEQLPGQVDRQEPRVGVDVLVAGHGGVLDSEATASQIQPAGTQAPLQDSFRRRDFFYSLNKDMCQPECLQFR